ncbi:ABC transporter permease [Candidatus Acetothermia bacterium]|nr:ABC transporter permease [Candidatus Acetothermia bacterium]
MEFLGQVFANGLFLSCLYALLALGTTLIFGVLRIGDLAQGALYALAGYLVFLGTKQWGLEYWLAATLAVVAVTLLSVLNGHFVYRRLRNLGIGQTFLGAVGLLIVIQNLLAIGFTWEPQAVRFPWGDALVQVGSIALLPQKISIIILAIAGLIGLWLFLRRSFIGKALRALAQNREAAQLVGVNASVVTALAFAIAGALSGSTGALMATVWPLTPYGGTLLVLKAFAITVIGMGQVRGAFIGALLVGMSEALVQGYWRAELSDLVPFVLLAGALILKPQVLGPEEDEKTNQLRSRTLPVFQTNGYLRYAPLVLAGLAVILPYFLPGQFWLHLAILVGINIIVVSGLDLLTGYAGIPSLAQAGLIGIGAYTSAILAMKLGWTFPLTLIGALIVTVGAANLIGLLGLRLKGRWTSFTFIMGIVIALFIANLGPFTGGTQGLIGVPFLTFDLPGLGKITLNPYRDKLAYFYLVLAFVVLALWLKSRIVHSRLGRALVAIREDDVLAQSVGISVERHKLGAFLLSAAFASIAGSLYAHYLAYLNPDLFTFSQSFNLFVMNLIGGAATLLGAVFGPVTLTAFAELTRSISGSIASIVFGILLIISLIYLPDGLTGMARKVWARLTVRSLRRSEPKSSKILEAEEAL